MDPMTCHRHSKLLLDLKKTITAVKLTNRVASIEKVVDSVGKHLAAAAIADMKAGFPHLETAFNGPPRHRNGDATCSSLDTDRRTAGSSRGYRRRPFGSASFRDSISASGGQLPKEAKACFVPRLSYRGHLNRHQTRGSGCA